MYQGEWKQDEKNGYGIYTFKNKDKYKGEWFLNNRHGKGVETD